MKTCLTIAGSDSSGGAGIQADLKTFAAHDVYGMSAITALTAQNTRGVDGVFDVAPEFVAQQIQAVEQDIPPDGIKIGMLANADVALQVAKSLQHTQCKNIVLDPVMVSTSGSPLLVDKVSDQALNVLLEELIPQVSILTPNLPELFVLCEVSGISVNGDASPVQIEHLTQELYKALNISESMYILSKGGHRQGAQSSDYLFSAAGGQWLSRERVSTDNTHGTGCTLSAAIAANLALGFDMLESVSRAKDYLTLCLKRGLDLGQGSGPLRH